MNRIVYFSRNMCFINSVLSLLAPLGRLLGPIGRPGACRVPAKNTNDYRREGLKFHNTTYDYRREGLKFHKIVYAFWRGQKLSSITNNSKHKLLGILPRSQRNPWSQPKWCQQVLLRPSLPQVPEVWVTGVKQIPSANATPCSHACMTPVRDPKELSFLDYLARNVHTTSMAD